MTQMGLKTLVISDAPLKNQSNDTLFGLLQAIWIFDKFLICNISDASKHCDIVQPITNKNLHWFEDQQMIKPCQE